MFESRYSFVDSDIKPQEIKSAFLRELVGIYDTYLAGEHPLDLHLVDPYQRFFFTVADKSILFEDHKHRSNFLYLPYVRMIYTVPHHRRKGIQKQILNDLKDVSDNCGHSFCICADPFQLKGFGRETNAKECLLKMVNHRHNLLLLNRE